MKNILEINDDTSILVFIEQDLSKDNSAFTAETVIDTEKTVSI